MGNKRISSLVERIKLTAEDFFAIDKASEADTKKLPASYFTDQFADMQNILGAKNILRYPYYQTTRAESGMTITDNGDGSITISGTATARVVFRFADNAQVPAFTPPIGTYKLVASGNSAGLYINFDAYNNTTWVKSLAYLHDNGISASFDVDYNGYNKVTGYIDIPSGTAITTPITIKPMIMPAHIEDTTWVPFTETNKQLTDEVATVKSDLSNKQTKLAIFEWSKQGQSATVPTGTNTAIAFIQLNIGTYIVIGNAQYSTSNSVVYSLTFTLDNVSTGAVTRNSMLGGGGCPLVHIIQVTSNNQIIRMVTNQGSGSTLTAAGIYMWAIKII